MAALMKGKVWKDHKHKVLYPVFAEFKYDEIRCHVKVHPGPRVEFLSYSGKPLANMQEFAPRFAALATETGLTEFDCGFEVNKNFNDSYRWVRSTKALPDDLKYATPRFILFDLPECAQPYIVRKGHIHGAAGLGGLDVPECYICDSEEAVQATFDMARESGHEGLMVKSGSHLYQRGKRIEGWLKLKPEETADGVIVELIEATATVADPGRGIAVGDPLGRIGSVRVRMEDGSEACPHGIAHDLGRKMLTGEVKALGEWCELAYMLRDRLNGYRHPTFRRLREAKI